MTKLFEDIKRQYPKTAKLLGITAGMDYEEYREALHRRMMRSLMHPLPVDLSGLKIPPTRWYTSSTKE
jgi:hypothetical protein